MINIVQQTESYTRYDACVRKAQCSDLWGWLTGQETALADFNRVRTHLGARRQIARGRQQVPLERIVGSVGRTRDFTQTFLPRACVNKQRWSSIDGAVNTMTSLPPVELFQIGDVYFVNDGNHRVSVARANGLLEIEAEVIEWVSPVSLTVEEIRQGWNQNSQEEKTMDYITEKMVQHEQKERRQRGAREQLAHQVATAQPGQLRLLLVKIGDLLVHAGSQLQRGARAAAAQG